MRVAIVSIQHESNTFIDQPTDLDAFRSRVLLTGEDVREATRKMHHEVTGFFEGLDAAGIQAVPIVYASATPSGAVTTEALDTLVNTTLHGLDRAGPIDGLLVAPHGAAVCASQRDMDGYWLSLLRDRYGPDLPIICTLDVHANVSPRMIEACDATILYRTNPHLDQLARGREAAELMARTLRGQVRPVQSAALPPVAINIEKQHTSESPCTGMLARADEVLARPGVLSDSVILGFPYADVLEMGSGFVVVTDGDRDAARLYAEELGDWLVERREAFVPTFTGVEEAIDRAADIEGPVCLLDMGDNVGGGSPADGTVIAHAVHRRGGPKTFVSICDPESAERARAAGVGAKVTLRVGGKTDARHGEPLEAVFTVRGLHDGTFTELEPRHGGRDVWHMGPTAVVETETGLTVQLTSVRTPPFSLGQIISCGLNPAQFKLLVAKGVNAPVAAYAPAVAGFVRVNTPGCTSADMTRFEYRHRRRPLYPFEPI